MQAARFGFLLPVLGVTVAVENDSLVVCQSVTDQLLQCMVKILGMLQHIGKLPQFFSHNGVKCNIRTCD